MRIWLNVPFGEKDLAKKLGCKFSGAERRWFIDNPENIEIFMAWIPESLKVPHNPVRRR